LLSDLAKIQPVILRATSSTLDLAVGAHEVLRLARKGAAEETGRQPPSEERTLFILERVALLLRRWSWIVGSPRAKTRGQRRRPLCIRRVRRLGIGSDYHCHPTRVDVKIDIEYIEDKGVQSKSCGEYVKP